MQPVQDVIQQIRKLLDEWRKHELPVYHTREGREGQSSSGAFNNTEKATDRTCGHYQVARELALRTILLVSASVTKDPWDVS